MHRPINWFERQFNFLYLEGTFPNLMERLSGTPLRLEYKVQHAPPALLTFAESGSWSIKEQIGHLNDLEPLWMGRILDIVQGKKHLRAADLTNRKTFQAHHNDRPLSELLGAFADSRKQMVAILADNEDINMSRSALHPRINQPMRIIDLMYFVAEHDDHHLASIDQLLQELAAQNTDNHSG